MKFSKFWIPFVMLSAAGAVDGTVSNAAAADPQVDIKTSQGTIRLELYAAKAPKSVENFLQYVKEGHYNGTVFHRVVREPVPFVVQGGDPQSSDPKTPVTQLGTGSFVDPATGEARFIPLELSFKSEAPLRYGEKVTSPTQARNLRLTHERGAVAMARSADPNSASAQFYVALEALPELDGNYAVFGRVVEGMDVVDRIQQGDRITSARLVEGGTLVKGNPNR